MEYLKLANIISTLLVVLKRVNGDSIIGSGGGGGGNGSFGYSGDGW